MFILCYSTFNMSEALKNLNKLKIATGTMLAISMLAIGIHNSEKIVDGGKATVKAIETAFEVIEGVDTQPELPLTDVAMQATINLPELKRDKIDGLRNNPSVQSYIADAIRRELYKQTSDMFVQEKITNTTDAELARAVLDEYDNKDNEFVELNRDNDKIKIAIGGHGETHLPDLGGDSSQVDARIAIRSDQKPNTLNNNLIKDAQSLRDGLKSSEQQ